MAELIAISDSVGRGGANQAPDVVTITTALTLIGAGRGGVAMPPLSVEDLGKAIENFQRFQKLPVADGRVDRVGNTIRRINAILKPGTQPPVPNIRTGKVKRLALADLPTTVDRETWTPLELSLVSDMVFRWTRIAGRGSIQYFELDDDVVPNWFGVVVPQSVTATQHVHIFFHPTPSQRGYDDGKYRSKQGWSKLFHYMSDPMAAQFCAAATGQVLIMPLMTQSADATCGVFPQRWEAIVGEILGLLTAGPDAQTADPVSVSSVVVSSFSSGITYSAAFRKQAKLGARLRWVVDFDGIVSSYGRYSQTLSPSGSTSVLRVQQTPAVEKLLPVLATQNMFPVPRPRWGQPWDPLLPKEPRAALLTIHGHVPQTMMYIAADRTRGQ